MKKIVISQPMFFPWRGMFEQIKLCDVFVYYDDVQLPKGGGKGRGFITRVQIKTKDGGWQWLSLPLKRPKGSYLLIKDAIFAHQEWRKKHLATIRNNYMKAPFFEETYEELLKNMYDFDTDNVSDFLIFSMNEIMKYIGLERERVLSSQLQIGVDQGASERVLLHCQYFEAEEYITGHGAKNYIDYNLFEQHHIHIHYMEYALSEYPQIHGAFNPYVSIVDLLCNVGRDANQYLCSQARYWKHYPELVEQLQHVK